MVNHVISAVIFWRCFRVSLDMMSVQANTGPSWENKSSLAFWRGRDSRQERLDLVRMSHRHPDIIDARLTRMFFFKHTPDLGDTVSPVSFFDFFKVRQECLIATVLCLPGCFSFVAFSFSTLILLVGSFYL